MKTRSRFFIPMLFVSAISFSFSACDSHSSLEKFEFQTIAWEALSADEQSTIGHDVREAVVNFDDEFRDWTQENPKTVQAVSVRFNTKDDSLLGPILVYISPKTKKVLGFGLRF